MANRGLLLLIGGRQVPNLLTVQYLIPDFVVPIASHAALQPGDAWSRIKPILQQLSLGDVPDPEPIDAFDLQQVRDACYAAIQQYMDVDWTFNITCGTAIMSIGAYEVGKEVGASVWYLDTATQRVVTLNGNPPADKLYHLKVTDYMGVYGRYPEAIQSDPTLEYISLARKLANDPPLTMAWRDALQKGGADRGKQDQPRRVSFTASHFEAQLPTILDWCASAQAAGLVSSFQLDEDDVIRGELPNNQLWKFVDGDWLEVYAWSAAHTAGCFDNYRYKLQIPGDAGSNELDLAITYSASLLIAECKTGKTPFETSNLDKIRSIAGMIGGSFVGCMFITSQSPSGLDKNQRKEYEAFCGQARARRIVVVTGDQLDTLTEILCREAGANPTCLPTYLRG